LLVTLHDLTNLHERNSFFLINDIVGPRTRMTVFWNLRSGSKQLLICKRPRTRENPFQCYSWELCLFYTLAILYVLSCSPPSHCRLLIVLI